MSRLLAGVPVRPSVGWGTAGAGAVAVAVATAASAGLPPMINFASIERPLLALASVPRRPIMIGQLPTAAFSTLADSDTDAVASPVADNIVQQEKGTGSMVSIPSATVSIEPPVATVLPRDEPVAAVPLPAAAAAVPEPQAPLASVLLAPAIHSPAARAARVSSDPPREVSGIGVDIGIGAARLGVATGDVAARAGTSIGRFFKNGGLAIASGF